MRVYFDYNATTPLAPDVADAVAAASREVYGNASSVHHFGQQAKAALDEARSSVVNLIGGDASELVFTGGGTESDNFAIRGVAEALEPAGRRHLVASAIEHEAVLNTLQANDGVTGVSFDFRVYGADMRPVAFGYPREIYPDGWSRPASAPQQ